MHILTYTYSYFSNSISAWLVLELIHEWYIVSDEYLEPRFQKLLESIVKILWSFQVLCLEIPLLQRGRRGSKYSDQNLPFCYGEVSFNQKASISVYYIWWTRFQNSKYHVFQKAGSKYQVWGSKYRTSSGSKEQCLRFLVRGPGNSPTKNKVLSTHPWLSFRSPWPRRFTQVAKMILREIAELFLSKVFFGSWWLRTAVRFA